MQRLAVLFAATLTLAGCQVLDPPQRLMAELQARGIPAALGNEFNDVFFGGNGIAVCAGDESIQVYVFADLDAAIDAAAIIDRDDPWHIGSAIVEWVGVPRFWLRDRAIIQYVGTDHALDAALRGLLGPPLAEGDELGGRGPRVEPACERAGA